MLLENECYRKCKIKSEELGFPLTGERALMLM